MYQSNVKKQSGPQGPQGRSSNRQSPGPVKGKEHESHRAHREQANALAIAKYHVGQVVEGRILHFFQAGPDHPDKSALVQLREGGTALMLFDQIPGYPRNVLSQVYAEDDLIDVEIVALNANTNRIKVSLKPVLRRKFSKGLERGHIVTATVFRDIRFGYLVDLGGGLEAILHNDNLEQNLYGDNERFEPGDRTEVVILSNEQEGSRISVGRWQLFEYL